MAVDVGSAVGYLDLDISGFLSGLNSAQSEADKASQNLATSMGKSFSSTGTALTKYVTTPLMTAGGFGLKIAMNFDKGMSQVQAITGATGKDLDSLRQTAIDLGGDTAYSATEVAGAMTEMAKAGWNTEQIISGMGGVLDAAAASGEDLSVVSTIVADAVTGFGLSASDSTRLADLFTQAANGGTIGINDLGESFKYIAPVAAAMGLSVEDTTTAIAAMSTAGIKGSQAGTSLRGMLTRMVKPTDQVSAAMDELGISLTHQDGTFKSLDDILGEMRTSFGGLTDEQKTYYAATLAGQEGMSGMLTLLNMSQEEYDKLAKSMDESGGVAGQTADVMQDNLASKIEQLGGSLESLAIKLSELVIPYIQKFVVWLTSLVDKFTALDPETQKTILKFVGLAAAAGPLIFAFGKVSTGVGSLITGFGKLRGGFKAVSAGGKAGAGVLSKLGGALAGVTAPMLVVVGIIAVLAAAFTNLWKNNEEFRNGIIAIWTQIKETFSAFAQGIVDRINALGFNFQSITEVLKAIWQGFCDFLAPIFTAVFQYISDWLKVILDVILGTIDFFVALFTGNWQGAWDAIKGIFMSVWNFLVSTLQNIGTMLIGIFDVICGWFGTTWENTWTAIKEFFVNTFNSIVLWITTTIANITTFLSDAWTNIYTTISTKWEEIKTAISTKWEEIKTAISNKWEEIKTKISEAIESVKTTLSNAWESVKSTVTSVWTGIKLSITMAWNAIKSGVSTAINTVKTKITTTFNSVKTTVTSIWDSIASKITQVWTGIKTGISTAVTTVKTTISGAFTTISLTASRIWNGIKTAIQTPIEGARDIVETAIDKIKGFFDFDFTWPSLKLPHFSFSGSWNPFDWPDKFPSVGVEWYKKAMNKPMLLDSATIFGYNNSTGQLMGGGEAGAEVVSGATALMNMIRNTVSQAIRPIIAVMHDVVRMSSDLGYVTYNGFAKQTQAFEKVVESGGAGSGGDTFVFNSPKPIDEIEAAKQMKKAKRDLAEGF